VKKVQSLLQTWFTTLFCLLLLPGNPENQNANMANNKQEEFVLSLDVGTTNIRAFIYDQTGAIRGHGNDKVSAKSRFYKVRNYFLLLFRLTYIFANM
jgi:hypothetical protein